MTNSTITGRAISVYIATLFVVVLFVMTAVLFVPAEELGARAALVSIGFAMFVIGTVGFHIRQ